MQPFTDSIAANKTRNEVFQKPLISTIIYVRNTKFFPVTLFICLCAEENCVRVIFINRCLQTDKAI